MPRTIAYNYPGFQMLPKGIKRMLLISETHFFGEEIRREKLDVLRLPIHLPGTPSAEARLI